MTRHTVPFALRSKLNLSIKILRTLTVLASVAMLLTAVANATDLVWIGGTGNWNAAGNWSPAQLPPRGKYQSCPHKVFPSPVHRFSDSTLTQLVLSKNRINRQVRGLELLTVAWAEKALS